MRCAALVLTEFPTLRRWHAARGQPGPATPLLLLTRRPATAGWRVPHVSPHRGAFLPPSHPTAEPIPSAAFFCTALTTLVCLYPPPPPLLEYRLYKDGNFAILFMVLPPTPRAAVAE